MAYYMHGIWVYGLFDRVSSSFRCVFFTFLFSLSLSRSASRASFRLFIKMFKFDNGLCCCCWKNKREWALGVVILPFCLNFASNVRDFCPYAGTRRPSTPNQRQITFGTWYNVLVSPCHAVLILLLVTFDVYGFYNPCLRIVVFVWCIWFLLLVWVFCFFAWLGLAWLGWHHFFSLGFCSSSSHRAVAVHVSFTVLSGLAQPHSIRVHDDTQSPNNNRNNVNKWILYVLKIDFVNEANEMQSYSSLLSTSNGNLMHNTPKS